MNQNLFEEDPEPHEDGGGSSLSADTVFILIQLTHIICGVVGVVEKIMETYDKQPICQAFFGNIIGNTLYWGCIIYCVFQNRYVQGDDRSRCDDRLDGWNRFEIRVMFFWTLSTIIFILYAYIFKFQSKWKKIQEKL